MPDATPTDSHTRIEQSLAQAREAMARGDLAQTYALGEAALNVAPNHAGAMKLMAEACLAIGLFDDAIHYRRRWLERSPPTPLGQVQLAEAYVHAGRLGDALAHYGEAISLDPSFFPAISGRAEVYEMQGNARRAWKTLEPALHRSPTHPSLAAVGIRVLMDSGRLDDAIALGERVMAADLPEEPQIRSAHLTMARAYERKKRFADALAAADRGNAMLRVPFRIEDYVAENDAILDAFDAAWMADAPRATTDGSWAVFIVGMPRSGSTLTERIIHAHPGAFGADEEFSLHLLANRLQHDFATGSPWPRAVRDMGTESLDSAAAYYAERLRARAPGAAAISNKDLANIRRLGLADLILPGAKFIHTVRDPADNCLSCYFERLKPVSVPYAASFDDLAAVYAQNLRLADHWRHACRNDLLTIRYEDLVEDLPGTARRIIDFVGLPWDDRCLRPHEANRPDRTLSVTQVRKPIYKSAKGRAERYGDLLKPLHEALDRHGLTSQH
ncbi:MAG: sulfotransferase [Planctomycetota bacterium]